MNILENDNTDISKAIQHASSQVENLTQEDNQEEQSFVDSFNDGRIQLNLINQFDNKLSVINCGDSGKDFLFTHIKYLLYRMEY